MSTNSNHASGEEPALMFTRVVSHSRQIPLLLRCRKKSASNEMTGMGRRATEYGKMIRLIRSLGLTLLYVLCLDTSHM